LFKLTFSQQSSEEIRFAVKELKVCEGSGKRTGEDEALALKRLNNKPHEHLIKLLATYTHRDRYHMIFPWADGNLRMLWQRLSINVAENSRSPQVAKWMSKQVLGLAHALQRIHYCENEERDVQDLPSHDNSKTHGRHGDLKPENILWFKTEATDSMQSFGVLKIADFGFADFHGPHSKSNIRMSAVDGYTETYKAPESDINKLVSPQYDIWSFGCILLQFVVWYLLGWEGVERFSEARMGESKSKAPIPSDKFHQVEIDGERKRLKAYLKSSVTEASHLLTRTQHVVLTANFRN
jgi:serine/threonine protein kinase